MRMAGEGHRFLSHAFLHAAVSGEGNHVVIENRVFGGVEAGGRHFCGNGIADRVGDALAQRSGGGFNARSFSKLRVAWRLAVEHAEV